MSWIFPIFSFYIYFSSFSILQRLTSMDFIHPAFLTSVCQLCSANGMYRSKTRVSKLRKIHTDFLSLCFCLLDRDFWCLVAGGGVLFLFCFVLFLNMCVSLLVSTASGQALQNCTSKNILITFPFFTPSDIRVLIASCCFKFRVLHHSLGFP